MRKRAYCFLPVIMAIAFLGASCESMKHLDPNYETLDERIASYHDAFQWRNYEKATYYVIPHKRDEYRETIEPLLDSLRVESYRITKIEENDDGTEATVVVNRSYFIEPNITLRTDKLAQTWVVIEGEWYLNGPPY